MTTPNAVDTEFVNSFIEHQSAALTKVMTDFLVAKARETVLEKRVAGATSRVEDLVSEVERLNERVSFLEDENSECMKTMADLNGRASSVIVELEASKRTIDDLFSRNASLDEEVTRLRAQLDEALAPVNSGE